MPKDYFWGSDTLFERFLCFLINSLCCFLCKNEYKRFISINDIKSAQRDKLIEILNNNKFCEYGIKFAFNNINSVTDYQNKVPLTTYEDYVEYIDKIKNGGNNILTSENILILEPTSGSSSASKLIPYTKSLKEEFQSGLKPWIYNLYSSYKGLKWGKSYWSVTPATTQNEYTNGGIPIGFEEDSEYLGNFEKKLMKIIFAVSEDIAKEKDMDEFYFKTALSLLKCKSLTLVSIWNPTFLLLMLEYIENNSKKLICALPTKRGNEVKKMIEEKAYHQIWRHLKVISCWCDANAKLYSEKLKALFPDVHIQAKGLLATEGFISLPFANENGARLSINSHFFEFISVLDRNVYLAHELSLGEEYEVVITTYGGLYRYKLNDLIKVTDFKGVFPLIRFIGKKDKVSDLFGEKMNELFVQNSIDQFNLKTDFYMLAPETDRYVLYIKSVEIPSDIDEKLRQNFHYDYCRNLGQLKEMKVFKLTGNPEQEYIDECVKRGQRLGDIKPTVLHLQGGWDKVFKGDYL